MNGARWSVVGPLVVGALGVFGVVGCSEESSEGRTDGSDAVVTASVPETEDSASADPESSAPASTAVTVAAETTVGAADPTSVSLAPDTTPVPDVDAEAVARVQSIVVQADDLPADQGWVQEDDDSFEPERNDDEQPEGCLEQAFDQAGVADDARAISVDTGFGRDESSYLTFGASQSDELPDLERLGNAVVACDGVTDADGSNLIVVRQPSFEKVDPSVAFVVNIEQNGALFNVLFVLAQRDDVTLLSSSTVIVGSAELEVELVLNMVDVMLGRV